MTRADSLRPLERRSVTVGIAAGFQDEDGSQGIVLCSDALVSGYLGKAQTMLKVKRLIPCWWVLVAGDDSDIAALLAILRSKARKRHIEIAHERKKMEEAGDPNAQWHELDDAVMLAVVREALAARKLEKAEELTQGRYGISYREFLDNGKKLFPEDEYRRDIVEIGAIELGAEFIVAGFSNGFTFLIETDTCGRTKIREDFAVIGSGATLAYTVMMHRAHSDVHSYQHALYCAFEAKKYAEGQPNVGEFTNIVTLRKDGKSSALKSDGRDWLNSRYQEFGPRDVPNVIPCPDVEKFNNFS